MCENSMEIPWRKDSADLKNEEDKVTCISLTLFYLGFLLHELHLGFSLSSSISRKQKEAQHALQIYQLRNRTTEFYFLTFPVPHCNFAVLT